MSQSDFDDPLLDSLRQTAERSREAVAIVHIDQTLLYTNPAFEALHGYEADELAGQSKASLSADPDPEGAIRHILEAARTQGFWEGKIENRRKDGTPFTTYAIVTKVPGSQDKLFVVTKHPVHAGRPLPPEAWSAHDEIIQLAGIVPGLVYRAQNDPQRTMRALSGEVETLTGYRPDALIENREVAFADLIHPADRTPTWESVQQQLADNGTYQVQYRLIAADGTEHAVWEKGRSLGPDPEGIELLEGSILDISEQRETQQRLREVRERYRQLFESLNDAAFVHPLNPDGTMGRFQEVNQVACDRLGYSREELLQMAPADLDSEKQQENLPDIADRLRSEESLIFEAEHVAHDGTLIPVEISSRLLDLDDEKLVLSLARDLRDRKTRDRMLRRLEWALNVRWRINQAVLRFETEAGLLQDTADGIAWAGEFPLAWNCRLVEEAQEGCGAQEVYLGGSASEAMGQEAFREALEESGTGDPQLKALESGQVTTVTLDDAAPTGWQSNLYRRGFRSVALLPLKYGEKTLGLLGLASREPATFEHRGELEVLEGAASDLGFGIHDLDTWTALQENLRKREQVLSDTIRSMARTVDERDPYTAGHQERVAQLAVAIATEMGFDENQIQGIQLGAWIHDIGKLKVPTDILNKPGPISDPEFAIIREHTEAGSRILADIDFPWPIQDMVRHHHERLDGSGYPDGLIGDQILPEARILAVADVLEAVTSHRPYRPALGLDKALAILRTERETKLDPEAVDACLALFEAGRFQWEDVEGGS